MKKILTTSILFLFILYSCGPSSKNEAEKWTKNLTELNTLKVKYPSFTSLIDEKIKEATEVYKSAESISDEEQKAQKMRDANNIFETGCLGSLKNIKAKFDALDKKKAELKKIRAGQSQSDISYSEVVIKDLERSVKRTKKAMKANVSPTLCDDFEDSYKNLIYSEEDIDRAISNIKQKIQDKKDSSSKVQTDNANSTNNKTEVAKDIKCEYCGVFNPPTSSKCSSCGAPLKK